MGLSWLQPMFSFLAIRNTYPCDGEFITDTYTRNPVGIRIGIVQCSETAVFIQVYLTSVLGFNVPCITLLNQKSHVISMIFM